MELLVVGTADGVRIVRERAGCWNVDESYLAGAPVSVMVPEDAGSHLVATDDRGLYRLDRTGGKTLRLGEGVLPDRIYALALAPSGRIFVGTDPAAIFISDDRGVSWRENQAVRALGEQRRWKYPMPSVGAHIRHVLVDWEDERLVYAAVQVGGILLSEDRGETWHDVVEGFDPDVHSLMQHPTKANVLYAITGGGGPVETVGDFSAYPPPFPAGRPFYRSDDRGKSWRCISESFTRRYGVGMRATSRDRVTLVAGVARDIPPFWRRRPEFADAAVFVSADDGDTWSEGLNGLPSHFSNMIEAIGVGSNGSERIFIGTGGGSAKALPEPERSGRIYVADDPNATWSRLELDLPPITSLIALSEGRA